MNRLNQDILDQLQSINWDFGTRKVVDKDQVFPFNNRRFFSYPATFIPEIPFSLIEILSKPGDVVLDPFGGIGTTFMQGLIQGRTPISIDNNSIAILITQDFYELMDPAVNLSSCLSIIESKIAEYNDTIDYTQILKENQENLKGWFEAATLNEVSFLVRVYQETNSLLQTKGLKSLYHLCLSNLLTTVCSQNGGWAYIADNVKPKANNLKNKHAIEKFRTNICHVTRNIQDYKKVLGKGLNDIYKQNESSRIIQADFPNMDISFIKEKIDLVVTSPPYPKMIDYVKSQRLSFCMENRSFTEELGNEIGARARRNNYGEIEAYVAAMKKCNQQINSCLKPGGYLCYVLPDFSSEANDERRNAIDLVISDLRNDYQELCRITRYIPGTHRSNNIKWASLKKEMIIIMEKDK